MKDMTTKKKKRFVAPTVDVVAYAIEKGYTASNDEPDGVGFNGDGSFLLESREDGGTWGGGDWID